MLTLEQTMLAQPAMIVCLDLSLPWAAAMDWAVAQAAQQVRHKWEILLPPRVVRDQAVAPVVKVVAVLGEQVLPTRVPRAVLAVRASATA